MHLTGFGSIGGNAGVWQSLHFAPSQKAKSIPFRDLELQCEVFKPCDIRQPHSPKIGSHTLYGRRAEGGLTPIKANSTLNQTPPRIISSTMSLLGVVVDGRL